MGEKLDFRQEVVRVEAKLPQASTLAQGEHWVCFCVRKGVSLYLNLLASHREGHQESGTGFGTNRLSSIVQKLQPEPLQRGQKEEVKGALKSLLLLVLLLSSHAKLWDTEIMT